MTMMTWRRTATRLVLFCSLLSPQARLAGGVIEVMLMDQRISVTGEYDWHFCMMLQQQSITCTTLPRHTRA